MERRSASQHGITCSEGWSFLPVYSSYTDLLGVSHGRMPCPGS